MLATTAPTPCLPFITARSEDAGAMFEAVRHAIEALSATDRDCLMLKGLVYIPAEDYLSLPLPASN